MGTKAHLVGDAQGGEGLPPHRGRLLKGKVRVLLAVHVPRKCEPEWSSKDQQKVAKGVGNELFTIPLKSKLYFCRCITSKVSLSDWKTANSTIVT